MFSYFLIFLVCILNALDGSASCFDTFTDPGIIETKQIHIPAIRMRSIRRSSDGREGCCYASEKLSRRARLGSTSNYHSRLGLVWLDENLCPVGEPTFLPSFSAEDGRLITVADELYLIYSDTQQQQFPGRGCRVVLANIKTENDAIHTRQHRMP